MIPSGIPGKQVRYRPHLYTHAQLRAIFDAADRIGASVRWATASDHPGDVPDDLLPRSASGEARRLHRNDVNLARGTIHIRESKGHKDRVVFLSADLHEYCRTYDAAINAHHPDRVAFFPNGTAGATARPRSSTGSTNCWTTPSRRSSPSRAPAAHLRPAPRPRHRGHQPVGAGRLRPAGPPPAVEPALGAHEPGGHLVLLPPRHRFPSRPACAGQHRHRSDPSRGVPCHRMTSTVLSVLADVHLPARAGSAPHHPLLQDRVKRAADLPAPDRDLDLAQITFEAIDRATITGFVTWLTDTKTLARPRRTSAWPRSSPSCRTARQRTRPSWRFWLDVKYVRPARAPTSTPTP